MALRRLDAELVRRKMLRSRDAARAAIQAGQVTVNGFVITKPARQVQESDAITVTEQAESRWASRAAHKLLGALETFHSIKVAGKTCLDAGASTGGFTDVLLDRDAAKVYAVDVGYGQLIWRLQSDARVVVKDRFNVRNLTADDLGESVDIVVADLSFISLRTVLPALKAVSKPEADLILMVKPQFEVGKDKLGKSGVVRDAPLRIDAVNAVSKAAADLGLGTYGVAASPLPGPSGNVEYFLWLRHGTHRIGEDEVAQAVANGPQ